MKECPSQHNMLGTVPLAGSLDCHLDFCLNSTLFIPQYIITLENTLELSGNLACQHNTPDRRKFP